MPVIARARAVEHGLTPSPARSSLPRPLQHQLSPSQLKQLQASLGRHRRLEVVQVAPAAHQQQAGYSADPGDSLSPDVPEICFGNILSLFNGVWTVPTIWDQVVEDMKQRDQFGLKKYGRHLEANDGRDTLVDAYEEALDLSVYLKKAIIERDEAKAAQTRDR